MLSAKSFFLPPKCNFFKLWRSMPFCSQHDDCSIYMDSVDVENFSRPIDITLYVFIFRCFYSYYAFLLYRIIFVFLTISSLKHALFSTLLLYQSKFSQIYIENVNTYLISFLSLYFVLRNKRNFKRF
jgi:hypothetical protein